MNASATWNEDPVARFAESVLRNCAWAETALPVANAEAETAIRLLFESMGIGMDLPKRPRSTS